MGENIEVKDVQKTEYLDKNGLDMLWAKVKENTLNQVEVERNRAVAKEDNITNSLSEFASKTTADQQYFRASVSSYDTIGTFSKEYGLCTAFLSDYSGNPRLTIRNPKRMDNKTILTASSLFITGYYGTQITISADGVQMSQKTTKDIVTANNSTAHIGLDDDQTEYTYVTPLENGKVPAEYLDLSQYAKKTDIPAVDTSDFVSKTTTDAQIINSALGIVGGIIQIVDSIADEDPVNVELGSDHLEFDGSDRSTIELNGYDVNSNKGSRITIEAFNENPQILLNSRSNSDTTFQNYLKITNEGISSLDNNANHVYATDGSIADLTQYAKKSEITAGGNVDDVQVNGVSVVENKIANIKPATKESLGVVKVGDGLNVTDGTISVDSAAIGAGNYIPYARYEHGQYIMLNSICVEESGNKNTLNSHIGLNGLSVYNRLNNGIHSNIQCAEIELQSDKNRVRINDDGIDIWKLDVHTEFGISDHLLGLSKRGVSLYGGDDNHVLTSNASTIDITQYVLKSVYDEKIAALEARIAALEAKHTETA